MLIITNTVKQGVVAVGSFPENGLLPKSKLSSPKGDFRSLASYHLEVPDRESNSKSCYNKGWATY